MTEQGLKAVVYPEIDPNGLDAFAKQIGEMLSQLNIPIGVTPQAVDNAQAVVQQTSKPEEDTSSTAPTNTGLTVVEDKDKEKTELEDTVKNGVESGLNESLTKDGELHKKKYENFHLTLKGVLNSLGKGGALALALGVGAVSVATMVDKIVKFLEGVSIPLKNVMDLFSTAFDLIWMPIGTLLAIELMPTLKNVFNKVGEWLSIAHKLYEEEGMKGLIAGAIKVSFDTLAEIFSNEWVWNALGTAVWGCINTGLAVLLGPLIGPDNVFLYISAGFDMVVAILSAVWHIMTFDFDALGDDFEKMGGSLEKMNEAFFSKIPDILSRAVEWMKGHTNIGILVTKLLDFLDDKVPKSFKETFTGWTDRMGEVGQNFSDGNWKEGTIGLLKNTTNIGMIGQALGFWQASGGIATQPTIAGIGEAGPEAIIPLSEFGRMASEYRDPDGQLIQVLAVLQQVNSKADELVIYSRESNNVISVLPQFYESIEGTLVSMDEFTRESNNVISNLSLLFNLKADELVILSRANNDLVSILPQFYGKYNDPSGTLRMMLERISRFGDTVVSIEDILVSMADSARSKEESNRIVPYNQIGYVSNEIGGANLSTQNNGNVINFYITGNNSMEIGDEVQKILEKTVGKASSKMMWW